MINAMVIDDNRITADSLCRLLTLLDIHTHPAYGPRAAMLALEEQTPDVVFVDINMPGIDGFEVISFLRREPRLSKIPIIVVTSDDQPETAKRAKDTGAIDVIIKPVMFDSIESALEKAKVI